MSQVIISALLFGVLVGLFISLTIVGFVAIQQIEGCLDRIQKTLSK